MSAKQIIITQIRTVFRKSEFPGANFLQGSFDGDEPYEEIAPFRTRTDWTTLTVDFLDKHASALNFFSEAGFRFFLPAYLVADLNDQLKIADPMFHLTHGFSDFSVAVPAAGHTFVVKSGKSTLINPRRYGAVTHEDYARYRLSIFTREEVGVIVDYLKYKHERDEMEQTRIKAALEAFWLERAHTAPLAEDLQRHLKNEQDFIEAIGADVQGKHE